MMGLDAEIAKGLDEHALLKRALEEGRGLITRRSIPQGEGRLPSIVHIGMDDPAQQTIQVLRQMPQPPDSQKWFTRCLTCNWLLEEIPWEEARERVPEYISYVHREFRICRCCGRVYWPGTHRERMEKSIEQWIQLAECK